MIYNRYTLLSVCLSVSHFINCYCIMYITVMSQQQYGGGCALVCFHVGAYNSIG